MKRKRLNLKLGVVWWVDVSNEVYQKIAESLAKEYNIDWHKMPKEGKQQIWQEFLDKCFN